MLKAEGVVAGVPDLMVAEPRGGYSGLFVEMKVKPNRPSKEQKEIIKRLEDAGYKVAVCYPIISVVRCGKIGGIFS